MIKIQSTMIKIQSNCLSANNTFAPCNEKKHGRKSG